MMKINIIQGNFYKPLEQIDKYKDIWAVRFNRNKEDDTFAEIVFGHKPNKKEIKEVIDNYYNNICDKEILLDFVYKEHPVYLSDENQNNFFRTFTLKAIALIMGIIEKDAQINVIFKLGTVDKPHYYKFNTLQELMEFMFLAANHVETCLAKCWKLKDSVDYSQFEV